MNLFVLNLNLSIVKTIRWRVDVVYLKGVQEDKRMVEKEKVSSYSCT